MVTNSHTTIVGKINFILHIDTPTEFATVVKTKVSADVKVELQIKRTKSIECPTCCYKCTKKSDLKRHMVVHSNEKPFDCKLCFM